MEKTYIRLRETDEFLRLVTQRKRIEDELRQAKEDAEAASHAKSQFLANMSHELRTPLNHIIGFTEMVVDKHFGDLNATQEEYLNYVLESSHHLLALINDILDLSKVEAGKMELAPKIFDLKELLANSLVLIREKASKNGITLSSNFWNAPQTILADERKVKQILYNLLSNAVKFTPAGGQVKLLARAVAAEHLPGGKNSPQAKGGHVQVLVQDTGIGISPQNLDRVFDTFHQVEASPDKSVEGTGLGLSLSKKLVELHGGRIWAESQGLGHGCRFSFTLPIRKL